MDINALKTDYDNQYNQAHRLLESFIEQFGHLLSSKDVTLGIPVEKRIKTWSSIQDKCDRKVLQLKRILDLNDLIGVRTILLFLKDLKIVNDLIRTNLDVLSAEDASTKLSDIQFGYQSLHYIVRLPKKWLELPSFKDLGDFKVEIQVRTMAQHIWATASHKLQYKQEESVPQPVRRAINRVSALLETVDLEFDRVLNDRRDYVEQGMDTQNPTEPLNVDILSSVLSEVLPPLNKDNEEDYANLMPDLTNFNITTVKMLRELLAKHKDAISKKDLIEVKRVRTEKLQIDSDLVIRNKRGVFFTHAGLTRQALKEQFGQKVVNTYLISKKPQR